jgi:hypothetical protein
MNRPALAMSILQGNLNVWEISETKIETDDSSLYIIRHKKTKDSIGHSQRSLHDAILKAYKKSMENPRYLL